jgi:hypothetical protein
MSLGVLNDLMGGAVTLVTCTGPTDPLRTSPRKSSSASIRGLNGTMASAIT